MDPNVPRFKLLGAPPVNEYSQFWVRTWWVFYLLIGAWIQCTVYFAHETAMKLRKGTSVGALLRGIIVFCLHFVQAPYGGDRVERFWFFARSRIVSIQDAAYIKSGLGKDKTEYPSYETREMIRQRDGFTCRVCGCEGARHEDNELHVDHVIPRKWGGSNQPENLRTLCRRCHGVRHLRSFYD
ncbi:HNH endonuclease [Halosimplex halobium]|uniref:HNH endonuclease n=1 Tax=Halosimplex halobium TaxID=3396618 RepID=UPI003F55D3F3